tara:strand:- start:4062 stop:4220 length:159 start_codon:yes stop_codon:yes gene_type:complete
METIAQVFGMTFVGIIMICIGWTIVEYIVTGYDKPGKRNKKLMDNLDKLDKS